jgi:hypothetical protein
MVDWDRRSRQALEIPEILPTGASDPLGFQISEGKEDSGFLKSEIPPI